MRQTIHDLYVAVVIATLIFQGVIGSAHLAFAAAALEGGPSPFICSVHASPSDPGIPGDAPEEPDPQGQRNCPVCASNHQAAGSLLLPVATVGRPLLRQIRHFYRAHDQWPADRQPQFANSRAPPRPV